MRAATTRRPSQVRSTSSTVDEFCWQHDRLAVAIFLNSRLWNNSRWKYPYFRDTRILITQCRISEPRKKGSTPKTTRSVQSFWYNTGMWQTKGQTDGHARRAYRARIASGGKNCQYCRRPSVAMKFGVHTVSIMMHAGLHLAIWLNVRKYCQRTQFVGDWSRTSGGDAHDTNSQTCDHWGCADYSVACCPGKLKKIV